MLEEGAGRQAGRTLGASGGGLQQQQTWTAQQR